MSFSKETEKFLIDLKFNNERIWFTEHKQDFENYLNKPFKEIAKKSYDELIKRFPDEGFDLHVSRIYRDARRLYGRGPYKEYMWFSIKDRSNGYNGAQFFFEVNTSGYCYGLGFYTATVNEMNEFRKSIDVNPERFRRLATEVKEMNEFVIEGPEYKRQKGDYGDIVNEWYNRKYTSVISNNNYGVELYEDKFYLKLVDGFDKLMPMYKYLRGFGKEYL